MPPVSQFKFEEDEKRRKEEAAAQPAQPQSGFLSFNRLEQLARCAGLNGSRGHYLMLHNNLHSLVEVVPRALVDCVTIGSVCILKSRRGLTCMRACQRAMLFIIRSRLLDAACKAELEHS